MLSFAVVFASFMWHTWRGKAIGSKWWKRVCLVLIGKKIEFHHFLLNLQIFFHGSPDFSLSAVGRSVLAFPQSGGLTKGEHLKCEHWTLFLVATLSTLLIKPTSRVDGCKVTIVDWSWNRHFRVCKFGQVKEKDVRAIWLRNCLIIQSYLRAWAPCLRTFEIL